MGFLEALLIAFIVLKLCGVIDWSWWAVLIPLFVDVVLYGSIFLYRYLEETRIQRNIKKLERMSVKYDQSNKRKHTF